MRNYIYEFIGTFFLVLTIGCVVLGGVTGQAAPIAIAGVLMALVYACGHASGAHFNPGVTLAVWIRGRCKTADIAPYMIAQVLAAVAASFVAQYFFPTLAATAPAIKNVPAAFIAELLFSFALCFVVLNVATTKSNAGNSFYGLAIGVIVLAGAYAVGGISGGAFNTAVAVGLGVMKIVAWGDLWIHIVANLAAGLIAGVAFKALNPEDK